MTIPSSPPTINTIPLELLIQILEYTRRPDLHRCTRVSSSWRKAAHRLLARRPLTLTLPLALGDPRRGAMLGPAPKVCHPRCLEMVIPLDLSDLSEAISQAIPHPEVIRTVIISPDDDPDAVLAALRALFPALEHLYITLPSKGFSYIHPANINYLSSIHITVPPATPFTPLAFFIPTITHLDIQDLTHFSPDILSPFLSNLPRIRTLSLRSLQSIPQVIVDLAHHCPLLTELSITQAGYIHEHSLPTDLPPPRVITEMIAAFRTLQASPIRLHTMRMQANMDQTASDAMATALSPTLRTLALLSAHTISLGHTPWPHLKECLIRASRSLHLPAIPDAFPRLASLRLGEVFSTGPLQDAHVIWPYLRLADIRNCPPDLLIRTFLPDAAVTISGGRGLDGGDLATTLHTVAPAHLSLIHCSASLLRSFLERIITHSSPALTRLDIRGGLLRLPPLLPPYDRIVHLHQKA